MKAYTVTEDQLENLGVLQLSTTICFALAASLFTFFIGVKQDVAFAGNAIGGVQLWWEGLAMGAVVFAALFLALGVYLFYKGRTTIGNIKRDTQHD